MTSWLNEQVVEDATIEYFRELGYDYVHGSEIEPDGKNPERGSFADVLLLGRLEEAVERLNPGVPQDAQAEAIRTIQRLDAPSLIANNEAFHKYLFEGVPVEVCGKQGESVTLRPSASAVPAPHQHQTRKSPSRYDFSKGPLGTAH